MTEQQRQRLYDFFSEQHQVLLLDDDLNEIDYIMNPPDYPITVWPDPLQQLRDILKKELTADYVYYSRAIERQSGIREAYYNGLTVKAEEVIAAIDEILNETT